MAEIYSSELVHDIDSIREDEWRVNAVVGTRLLDTPPEPSFDRLTKLASALIEAPVTFMSLVDAERDFYKSAAGFDDAFMKVRQLTGRTFCHYTLSSPEPLVIDDVMADPKYREVPTVKSIGVRAYLGVPLVTDDGRQIGSFCAVDFKARSWTSLNIETLQELARTAMQEIQLRILTDDAQIHTRKAEELAARQEQMIANVAHDLRSPLQVLNFALEILASGKSSLEQRERAAVQFKRASERMTQMLENLLGTAPPSRAQGNALQSASLLADAIGMMQPIAEPKSIRLLSRCDRGLSPINADYQSVLRVFSNLIGNAIKFSAADSSVQLQAQAEGKFVRFSVTDSGPGVPKNDQLNIFDRHWRTDESGQASKGLGLSIAKQIVEELGGAIGVNSESKGSEFFFTVPIFQRRWYREK